VGNNASFRDQMPQPFMAYADDRGPEPTQNGI
jgi:hypothetical protein